MTPRQQILFSLSALLIAMPAHAQYKVVGPDGKITYTDRPSVSTENKVMPVARNGTVPNDVSLPYEVRQAIDRYPVTLYVATNCSPCDKGRQLLRERGVPFSEKSVTSNEDVAALQGLTGSSNLPAVSIGPQILQGFQRDEWMSYLDAAGYPKESRLPANFPQVKATPLTERKEQPAQAPAVANTSAPARPAAAQTPAAPATPAPSGFRF